MSDNEEVENFIRNLAENELAHYGVLGMKWGRRKAEDSGPSKREVKKAEKKEFTDHREAARKAANRDYFDDKDMSDIASDKTKKLEDVSLSTAVGGIGLLAVGAIASDPRIKAGAFFTSTVLSAISIGTQLQENKSLDKDLMAAYDASGKRK